jgi:phosphatidate cytidylyltransferase
VYLIITQTILVSILYGGGFLFSWEAGLIVLFGFYEILKAWHRDKAGWPLLMISLLLYVLIASGFLIFSTSSLSHLVYVYLLVLTFDGFSQLSGQLFGKHKLFMRVSPNKTIEGFAGGLLFALITSVFVRGWIGVSVLNSLFLAGGICVSSLTGDLLASAYKRRMGIKDFGTVIPGHGGVLDRFDSFLAAGGFYFLLSLWPR